MKKYFFVLFIWLLTHSALAVPVANLYSASVAISSETKPARTEAIQQAFRQVLIKVSGNPSIATASVIIKHVKEANNYLQAYTFQSLPIGKQTKLFLTATFNEKAINDLLLQGAQSVWGINRPLTLVWLVIQQPQEGTQISPVGSDNQAAQVLQAQANNVGLPIMFPILDLTDIEALSGTDLLQTNILKIMQASARYNTDAILAGRVSQTALGWQANWLLLNNGKETTWTSQGKSLIPVLGLGVSLSAQVLASRYKITPNKDANITSQPITLIVNNITDMTVYSKVLNYLHQLTSVKQIEVSEVSSDKVVFNIELKSDEATFMQAIALDHALMPIKQTNPGINGTTLYYQWVS